MWRYGDPNGFIEPNFSPSVYYDSYYPAKWESNGQEWIKTEEGKDCSDLSVIALLGDLVSEDSQIKRVSRRRKQANRMFTIGNSNLVTGVDSETQDSMLGDDYTVKGRDYPFGGKIEE